VNPSGRAGKPKSESESGAFKKKETTTGSRPALKPGEIRNFENTAGFKLAEKILDRSKLLDPELVTDTPRRYIITGTLDHRHAELKPLFLIFAGVVLLIGLMAAYTFWRFHELPIPALSLIVLGAAVAGAVVFTYVPPGCDCRLQKQLIANGVAITGQITEKHAEKPDDAEKTYELDYAFQPDDSEESNWGRMTVTREQFAKFDEGDDVTVLYLLRGGKLVSRIYRLCAFRAEAPAQAVGSGSKS
jgi:hypothetical protein